MSLQAVMGSCATACSCLLFMLSYQIPRPGAQWQGQVVRAGGLGLLRACERGSEAKVFRRGRPTPAASLQSRSLPRYRWWQPGFQAACADPALLRCNDTFAPVLLTRCVQARADRKLRRTWSALRPAPPRWLAACMPTAAPAQCGVSSTQRSAACPAGCCACTPRAATSRMPHLRTRA